MRFHTDFYHSSLVPIGLNDQTALKDNPLKTQSSTHWMIALEGFPKKDSTRYVWKVLIYFTDPEGTFTWEKPFYTSKIHDCFHTAYETAKHLERSGRNDQLYSLTLQEKIS